MVVMMVVVMMMMMMMMVVCSRKKTSCTDALPSLLWMSCSQISTGHDKGSPCSNVDPHVPSRDWLPWRSSPLAHYPPDVTRLKLHQVAPNFCQAKSSSFVRDATMWRVVANWHGMLRFCTVNLWMLHERDSISRRIHLANWSQLWRSMLIGSQHSL